MAYLYHICLLLHVTGEEWVNLPYFLCKISTNMAIVTQNVLDSATSNIYHIRLIKLLIVTELKDFNLSQEQFLRERERVSIGGKCKP